LAIDAEFRNIDVYILKVFVVNEPLKQ